MNNTTKKTLTISVAAYNVEKTIKDTLNSMILDEKYMSLLDIVVVDDGSIDNTANIVKAYEEEYPDSIRLISKPNGGHGSTITTALAEARGIFFKIVDGDDIVDGQALCELISFLLETKADMVLSPFYQFEKDVQDKYLIERHHGITCETMKLSEARFDDGLAVFEIAIRTKLIREFHPVYAEHCFYVDNEFVMAAGLCADTVAYLDKAVSCYRVGQVDQSMSIRGKRRHFEDCFRISEILVEMYARSARELEGGKRMIAESLLSSITRLTYISTMLQENPLRYRRLLKEYDSSVTDIDEDFYYLGNKSRIVKTARSCPSIVYLILCKLIEKKERKGINW